jgi:eukaryotic-like serine/threonine-protein kinase
MSSAPLPPERWAALQAAVDGALDVAPAARAAFLRAACGDDADLLERAERLLAACDAAAQPANLLSGSAYELAAPVMAEVAARDAAEQRDRRREALHAVRQALSGRYDVERELARGGMATVYLAHDARHERAVAIKVLERSVDPAGAERFLREIRITARLTHPHVLTIHDSGEAEGFLYFVMPLAPGETLRSRLRRDGPLPVGDAVRLLRDIADGLAYAHGAGLVHRDLKPENVLLSGDHAVIADFGIARAAWTAASEHDAAGAAAGAADPALPAFTMLLGTPAYMAPEQAQPGAAADHRADLYALGIIAHEMLTGEQPAASPARGSLRDTRDDVPAWLDALIRRLLEPDPRARPESAAAVQGELERGPAEPGPRRRSTLVGGAAAAVLLMTFAAYAGVTRLNSGDAAASPAPVQAIAVLPFSNGSETPDYTADAVSDELAHTLGRLPGLHVAGATSARFARLRGLSAREAGRALNVAAVVTGTVRRSDGGLRVAAAVTRTADGSRIWENTYDAELEHLPALQDEIAGAVAAALLPATPAVPLSDRGTADAAAYDLYMKGRFLFLERGASNVAGAVDHFRQAVARDPGFARAHAALAIAYGVLPTYVPNVTDSTRSLLAASARRAAALDSTLADVHVALAIVHENALQFDAAVARYRRAIELEPSNVMAYHALGFLLRSIGRTDDALPELQRAARLDPLAKSVATAHAGALISARRFPEAAAEARRALALDPAFPLALGVLAAAQAFGGQPDSAIATLRHAPGIYPQQPGLRVLLMYAYAAAGRWNDAVAIRDSVATSRGDGDIHTAVAELILGNRAPILDLLTSPRGQTLWLNESPGFGCDPMLDPLWSEPRFVAAMRELGVAACEHARPWPFMPPGRAVNAR